MAKRQQVVEQAKNGCYLNIEASPGAREMRFSGRDRWRGALKVDLASPPISGKANAELIGALEGKFPEVKGSIAIAKGGKSRSKRVFIPLDAGLVRERLGLKDD